MPAKDWGVLFTTAVRDGNPAKSNLGGGAGRGALTDRGASAENCTDRWEKEDVRELRWADRVRGAHKKRCQSIKPLGSKKKKDMRERKGGTDCRRRWEKKATKSVRSDRRSDLQAFAEGKRFNRGEILR